MKQAIIGLNQLEKDLKAYFKKVKQDTKDFKKKYTKLSKKVSKLMNKTDDPDKLHELDKPLYSCDSVLFDIESYFSQWDYYH